MKVTVCHSGRQHSHRLALALNSRNLLQKYFTGVPAHPKAMNLLLRLFMRKYLDAYSLDINPALVEHCFVAPLVRKSSSVVLSRPAATDWAHRAEGFFDQIISNRVAKTKADVVIAYENASEKTFEAAKRMRAMTILDAASFHHTWQDKVSSHVEPLTAHERITRRKDREIALADYIFTVSDLARESYMEAGVAPERVVAIPMGADLSRFKARGTARRDEEPLRFLYVGHIDERKGVDVLKSAIEHLEHLGCEFQLSLIGKYASDIRFDGIPQCRYLGWMPQHELAAEMPKHDVLVLPSRHDSFGMVVAEAMASGLSVIATDNVGAKEMITSFVNGDIVRAGDVAALAESMKWFLQHPEKLTEMSKNAVATASRYTWEAYGERVCFEVSRLYKLHCNQN